MTDEPIWQGPGELIVVSGVVHARDASGSKANNAETWTLKFAFETWRSADGVLKNSELAVRKQVTKEELRAYMSQIQPYDVLSVRVIFTGPASAELLEILGKMGDPTDPLVQRAVELSKPVTREHERFGTLTLDRRLNWYRAMVFWQGSTIHLNLMAADDAELQAALQAAVALWDDQAGWSKRIQDYAVQELLDLKNDSWLDDDEPALTADEFIQLMTLEAITVTPDGGFDFWHNDGDLFWGHAIQVSGSVRDGPTRADIPG